MKNLKEIITAVSTKAVEDILDAETYGWPVCTGILFEAERPVAQENTEE
ncbi:MAG: hypothetical protein RSA20_09920 [Oscillospiraceae bacterium]